MTTAWAMTPRIVCAKDSLCLGDGADCLWQAMQHTNLEGFDLSKYPWTRVKDSQDQTKKFWSKGAWEKGGKCVEEVDVSLCNKLQTQKAE